MADIKYIQSENTRAEWQEMPILLQMGNIGSEVSRALKWQAKKKDERMNSAIDRALELFDWTIAVRRNNSAVLREVLLAREEFCQYFFGGEEFDVDPEKMMKYYDGFVMMARGSLC